LLDCGVKIIAGMDNKKQRLVWLDFAGEQVIRAWD